MNLSEINSPADLVKANQPSPEEQAIETVRDFSPDAQLELAKHLIEDLVAFHQWVITKRTEEGKDLDPQWFVDVQSLIYASKIIQTVEL